MFSRPIPDIVFPPLIGVLDIVRWVSLVRFEVIRFFQRRLACVDDLVDELLDP